MQSTASSAIPTIERTGSCSRSKSATPINSKDIELNTTSSYINSMDNSQIQLPIYHHQHYHSTPITHSSSTTRARHENDDSNGTVAEHPRSSCKLGNNLLGLRSTTATANLNKSYATSAQSVPSDYLVNGSGHRSANRVSSLYEHNTPSQTNTPFLYASYNPKRRTSSYITPTASSSSINGNYHSKSIHDHSIGRTTYSTLTQPRKPRTYDHRSISMLDSNAITACSLAADRRPVIEPHQQCHHFRSAHEYAPINLRYKLLF